MNLPEIKLRLSSIEIIGLTVSHGYLDLDYICDGTQYHLVYDGMTHRAIDDFRQSDTYSYVSFSNAVTDEVEANTKQKAILTPVLTAMFLNPQAFSPDKT